MIVVGDFPELKKVPITSGEGWSTSKTIGTVAAGIGAAAIAATGVGLIAEVAVAATAATAAGATGFGAGLLAKKGKDKDSQNGPYYLQVPSRMAKRIKWSTVVPQGNVLYIGHPVKPEVYFPAQEFHQSIVVSKFDELLRLIIALRPREFTVSHIKGWAGEGRIAAHIKALKGFGTVNAKMTYRGTKDSREIASGTSPKPNLIQRLKKPVLPQDLVWLPFEGKWQALVDARMNGFQDIDIDVESRHSFGITAGLGASIKKIKNVDANLDAEYAQYKETIWHISGRFW